MRALGIDVNLEVTSSYYDDSSNDLDIEIEHLVRTGGCIYLPDIIVSVIRICESLNYNWQAAFLEVHRSNLSKRVPREQAEKELEIARDRYPNAFIVELQEYCLLKCADTNKVIKPACYSEAVMEEEWYNTTK